MVLGHVIIVLFSYVRVIREIVTFSRGLADVCGIDYFESVDKSPFRGEIFDNLFCNCRESL